jgi:hypothetical protein
MKGGFSRSVCYLSPGSPQYGRFVESVAVTLQLGQKRRDIDNLTGRYV